MQIKALIFYHKKLQKRILPFKLGRVNIITGESKTGKTAVIDIVNYCLGSDDCKISEGVIRDTVEWFGILLQLQKEEIFIARQNPNRLNQASTQQIYFANSDSVVIPEYEMLKNNSNIETLKTALTEKLFIPEYTSQPFDSTGQSIPVSFRHSIFYSFQPQDLIAQRESLFFNQKEQYIGQAIRNTLPYFLGAVREDTLSIQRDIETKKKELKHLKRNLEEYDNVYKTSSKKIFELVEEAKQLNLIPVERMTNTSEESLIALKDVLQWEQSHEDVIQGENENLKKLIDERTEFENILALKRDEIRAVEAFVKDSSDFVSEVSEQGERLQSINLITATEHDLHTCPLCSQHVNLQIPSIEAINKSLHDISHNLSATNATRPKLVKYKNALISEENELKFQIEARHAAIRAIYKEKVEAEKQFDLNLRKGKIIGKISLFIESNQILKEDTTLKDRIKSLENDLEKLVAKISLEENESRTNSILNQLNVLMTNWSNQLDLEHNEAPIRFDLKKLTIFADTPYRSIPLRDMGSGANWVAYHLLIHLALHKHFIKASRPVPRFLIIDQPSQAYYPPDKVIESQSKFDTSSDEKAVEQMYKFIIKVTKELAPNLQVIILDHAKLNFDGFKECIIEEWRDRKKLIPQDWIDGRSELPFAEKDVW